MVDRILICTRLTTPSRENTTLTNLRSLLIGTALWRLLESDSKEIRCEIYVEDVFEQGDIDWLVKDIQAVAEGKLNEMLAAKITTAAQLYGSDMVRPISYELMICTKGFSVNEDYYVRIGERAVPFVNRNGYAYPICLETIYLLQCLLMFDQVIYVRTNDVHINANELKSLVGNLVDLSLKELRILNVGSVLKDIQFDLRPHYYSDAGELEYYGDKGGETAKANRNDLKLVLLSYPLDEKIAPDYSDVQELTRELDKQWKSVAPEAVRLRVTSELERVPSTLNRIKIDGEFYELIVTMLSLSSAKRRLADGEDANASDLSLLNAVDVAINYISSLLGISPLHVS